MKMPTQNGHNYEKWKKVWSCEGWSYCDKELRTQTTRTGITPNGQRRKRTALSKKKMIVWRMRTWPSSPPCWNHFPGTNLRQRNRVSHSTQFPHQRARQCKPKPEKWRNKNLIKIRRVKAQRQKNSVAFQQLKKKELANFQTKRTLKVKLTQ